MKETRPDPLLKEILAGADLAGFRRASLERGLTTMRRHRRQRRVVRVCAAASMLLVLCAVVVFNQSRGAAERRMAAAAPSSVARGSSSSRISQVKTIGDDELFALFPGRAMALVGKPGEQQLVFLDMPAKRRQQSRQ
jgi:hypothetical protein